MAKDMRAVLIANLKVLRTQEASAKQVFKMKAYDRVIRQIELLEGPITSIEQVTSLEGVGASIKKKLETIFADGFLESTRAELLDGSKTSVIEELVKIMSIGSVKATSLVRDHDIKTIRDLEEKVKNDPSLLNEKQTMGLKYHADFMERIPRAEMIRHASYIKDIMASIDNEITFEVTGSFRRLAPSSGDIDVLITHPTNKNVFVNVVNAFKKEGYLYDDFASGAEKYMGVCKLKRFKRYRRIDLLFIDPAKYAFALFYFTGSQEFNVEVRNIALEKGYSLSEHGIKYNTGPDKGAFVVDHTFETEQDIFAFLNIQYVEPCHRKKGAAKLIVV